MKKLPILFLILLFYTKVLAIDYYVANSGNDGNDGISPGSPFKTIAKLNSVLPGINAGDRIYFNCGDIFEGEITIPSGITGSKGTPILFSSYGSGSKPVIMGSVVIASWTLSSTNIWQTSVPFNSVSQVFKDDQRLVCARTPNTGYFRMDAINGNNGFTDDILSQSVNYWENASLRFHLNEFWWEDAIIDSSSVNGYLGFTYETSSFNSLIPGSGYFIENKKELLDTLNEWFFDVVNKILYLYSPSDPSSQNIRATVYNNGLITNWPWVSKYITVENLEFREQAQAGICIRGSEGLIVSDCSLYNMGQYGILMSSDYSSISRFAEITGNYTNNCISNGIYTFNVGNSLISHNTIKNSGVYPSTGGASEACGQSGMRLWFGDSLTITYNKIDSSANCGICLESSYNMVEKNVVDHSMLLLSDGSAIYNNTGSSNIYRNNILKNTLGDMTASPSGVARYTKELYLDSGGEHNSIIEDNTLLCGPNVTGIGLTPNTGNLTIRNNVAYKCYRGLEIYNYDPMSNPVTGLKISKNIFYSNVENGYPYYVNAWNGLAAPYTKCDSNYLCNPYSNKIVHHDYGSNTYFLDWPQWKTESGTDVNSTLSFFQWTYPSDSSFILINETDSTIRYNFDKPVLNLDNVQESFSVLPPFSSKVLIGSAVVQDTEVLSAMKSDGENPEITLYPNPSNDILIVRTQKNALKERLEFLDFTGRLVYSSIIQSTYLSVNTAGFKEGIYLVRIGDSTRRLVIQH